MSAERKLPILLAHGIAKFDIRLELLKNKLALHDDEFAYQFQYFKGIKSHLEAHGFEVFHADQDFAGPVALRAEQLRDRVGEVIETTGAARLHIIAHSMGGLDARHMIVDEGMSGRVASLTTIGTPHPGMVLADHVVQNGGVLPHRGAAAGDETRRRRVSGFNDRSLRPIQPARGGPGGEKRRLLPNVCQLREHAPDFHAAPPLVDLYPQP
ncbi:MAG TPA: alpha/beta fold hydrolase [Pyrinomonadaceae bacterium]|nr:alpha/beta fold hydrolase [Pyrinomonadaceae bacterium]